MYFVINNFLKPIDCDTLLNYYIDPYNIRLREESNNREGQDFFNDRVLSFRYVLDSHVHHIMNKARMDILNIIRDKFNIHDRHHIYPENSEIVKWDSENHSNMGKHRDTSHILNDIKPHPTLSYQYTTIVYLNDNFKGGETTINNDIIIPEQGKLVILDSSILHGVNDIISGERYTMPMWFTSDINYYEDDYTLNMMEEKNNE